MARRRGNIGKGGEGTGKGGTGDFLAPGLPKKPGAGDAVSVSDTRTVEPRRRTGVSGCSVQGQRKGLPGRNTTITVILSSRRPVLAYL